MKFSPPHKKNRVEGEQTNTQKSKKNSKISIQYDKTNRNIEINNSSSKKKMSVYISFCTVDLINLTGTKILYLIFFLDCI